MGDGAKTRREEWTSSVAVGSKSFIENVKARLGFRAKGRNVVEGGKGYQLRESPAHYKALFQVENEDIDLENTLFWDVKSEKSISVRAPTPDAWKKKGVKA